MTKGEFMRELGRKLSRLPENEKKDALEYYYDYFAEAGIMEDMLVPSSMESPDEIAKNILAGYDHNRTDAYHYDDSNTNGWNINENKNPGLDDSGWFRNLDGTKMLIVIVALIALSPVIFGVMTGVIATLMAAIFSLGIIAFAFAVVGVASIASAFISSGIAGAILLIGMGLLFLAIAIGSGCLLGLLCGRFIPWLLGKCGQLVKWVFGKN